MELSGLWSFDKLVTPVKDRRICLLGHMANKMIIGLARKTQKFSYQKGQEEFCNRHFVQTEYQYLVCPRPCRSVTFGFQICHRFSKMN